MDFTDGPGGEASSDTGHGDPSNDAGTATPHGAVRSVAEEAALLVDLLGARGWAGFSGASGGSGGSAPRPEPGVAGSTGPCTCGGQQPAACRLCPVCQLIAFVQGISPETIERMAEVVDLAATALRDLATTQRARQSSASEDPAEDPAEDPDGGTTP